MTRTLFQIIALASLWLWGCQKPIMKDTKPTFLALGDSYTIGESVAADLRWPALLQKTLLAKGIPLGSPTILAKTGWTTDELQTAMDQFKFNPTYDLVSLLIGVNNQYRGRSADQYRKEFTSLLSQAITLSGNRPAHVLVVSIPDWGVTPFAEGRDRAKIAREIDQFNQVNREEAQRAGVLYLDITDISRQPRPEFIASDGLHPSGLMYQAWVDRLVQQYPNLLTTWK